MNKKLTYMRWLLSFVLVAIMASGFAQNYKGTELEQKAAAKFESEAVLFDVDRFTPDRGTTIACPGNLNEGFEGITFPPAGWRVINMGDANQWVRNTSGPRTGTACATISFSSAAAHNDWLITPALLPASGNSTFSFYAKNGLSSYPEQFNVLLSTTGNNAADFTVTLATGVTPTALYSQYSYDLSAYVGQVVYVAIQATSLNMYYLYVDDVTGPPVSLFFNGGSALAFGPTFQGQSYTLQYEMTNCGSTALTSSLVSSSPEVSVTGLPASLAPGATAMVDVTFTPSAAGSFAGNFVFNTNDPSNATVTVNVTSTVNPVYESYFQDFNSTAAFGVPAYWTGNFSVRDNGGVLNSKRFTRNLYASQTTGQFGTPYAQIVPLSKMAFYYRAVNFTGYPSTPTPAASFSFKVKISTDYGVTFTDIYTFDPGSYVASVDYKLVEIPLAAYAGQTVMFLFESTRSAGDFYLDFDDISVTAALPGLEFVNENLDMGNRPIGAWMKPATYEIINNPGEGNLVITDTEIDNDYNGFVGLVNPTLPFTLNSGETTHAFGLMGNDVVVPAGAFNGTYAIIFGSSRALALATYSGNAYLPVAGDVAELALPIATFPFTATAVSTAPFYANYDLPGTVVDGKDIVYTINVTTDRLLNVTLAGADAKFALYPAGFGGVGGPDVANAITSGTTSLTGFPIFNGTYFLVVSTTGATYDLTVDAPLMPVPATTTYIAPADGAINITSGTQLRWTFGNYTEEYQVILGTTYPPTTVVVPWTANLATAYTTVNLLPNMQYFWQVNTRNSQGTTNGDVWGFTTTISLPTGLTATVNDAGPQIPNVSVDLNWTGPSDRAFIGYNVYRNGVKLNTTPLTTSAYSDLGLSRNTTYSYRVSNVYDEGESAQTAAVVVTTKGAGIFSGFVYDQLTSAPIAGARLHIEGTAGSYDVFTSATGAYTTAAYAGTYNIIVSAGGYTSQTRTSQILAHNGIVTNDFYLMEVPYPLEEVVAIEQSDDQVLITWGGVGVEPISTWLSHDDGVNYDGIGAGGTPMAMASRWTPELLDPYADSYLTKVSFVPSSWGTDAVYEINVWKGTTPTLVYSQSVTSYIVDQWNEITLTTPIEITGDEEVWFGYSVLSYSGWPAGCDDGPAIVGYGDKTLYDGVWYNLMDLGPTLNYNWNIKGFVTNQTRGTTELISRVESSGFMDLLQKNYPATEFTASGNVNTSGSAQWPKTLGDDTRGVVDYSVYREKVFQPGTMELIGNTFQDSFVDFEWGDQDWGVYRWAVAVNYDGGQTSPLTYSNKLDKDMYTTVDVTIVLNSNDSPANTQVTFTNTSEPELELVYDISLPGSGLYTWDEFRKGVYDIMVFKAGYTSVELEDVIIFDETSFEWLLTEILAPPTGLYVTPTAYATWMTGSALPFEPFIENFDGGTTPEGWTVTQGALADPDGDMWHVVNPVSGRIFTNTPYMLVDSDAAGMVITNSILTSPVVDASNAGALYLSFDQYFNEYSSDADYAKVQVFDGSDWVTILNQTTDIGSWSVPNHQVLDVTAYANPAFQVRFEYYGDWAFYWALDNVQITESSRMSERSLVGFKVFLDGLLVEDTSERFYQYGTNGEELVDGETYLAEVAAEYSTGQSARAQYTFTYIACENYPAPADFTAEQVIGTLDVALAWTVPTVPGEDQIDFARIYRDGEIIDEVTTASYLDEDMAIGSYQYCITFVYESGAETCLDDVCTTAAVTGDAEVNGNVSQAEYLGGDGIEGAIVKLTHATNPSITFTFTTDADGDYEGEVIAGTYNYTVDAEGYISQTLAGVVIPQSGVVTRDFIMMEFPAPVELVIATELTDNTVRVSWRSPGTILFSPFTVDFNSGMPQGWTVTDGGSTSDTWQVVANSGGSTLGSGSFAYVDSDAAGSGSTCDELLTSPVYNTLGASELYLQFKQYYRHLGTGYGNVEIFDGTSWVTVLNQTATAGSWTAPDVKTINVTQYANPNFQVRFHYSAPGWYWYWAVDDVTLTDVAPDRVTALAPPESTLAGYNVYRTTCTTGELQFLGYTLDSIFDDNTWATAAAGMYKWGVEAVYAENESEVRFSNCLDKDMVTQVSVTVITNSGDSPEGTDVMFTNISEPDLGLVYETELDGTGYYMWDEFRKGTYDIYAELEGFEPINLEGYVIDGPEAFEWILSELLSPVSDLHVSPTGYATWRAGNAAPFEPLMENFDAGVPEGWTIEDGGNTTHTWMHVASFSGNSLDGTPFMMCNSDAAGSSATLNEKLISPVLNASGVEGLYITFDLVHQWISDDYLSVEVFDGSAWVEVLKNQADTGPYPWGPTVQKTIDATEYANENFQVRFIYFGTYDWYAAIDNVAITNEAPEALEYYKVWLDGIFVADTPDTWYQYDPSTLVPGQEYFSEVAAMYSNGMSPKMNYTWTYFPCDSFPGPEDLEYEVVDNSDVVLTWGGSGPPPPPGGGLEEDFETGSLSAGWTVEQTNTSTSGGTPGYWTVNNYVSADFSPFGTYHAGLWWDYGHQDEWLITPEFACDADAALNFWSVCYEGSVNGDHYYVKVSTNGGSTWTELWDASDLSGGWNYYNSPYNLSLDAYAGQDIKLAFQAVDGDGQGLWYIFFVDNITVSSGTRTISFPAESLTRKSYSTTATDMVARDGNTLRSDRSVYAEKDPNAAPRNISVERAIWDVAYSFDADTPSGLTGLAGSETDGTYIYAARWSGSEIAKFDAEGNFIETFSIPGVSGLRDLAFDGTYMYGAAATTTVWKMDFTTKTLVSTFTAPTAVRAIAYDSDANAFWGNNWSTDMILFNEAGQNLDQLSGMPSMYGAAYDNFSEGGPYLWFFTGTTTGGGCQVEQYNLATQSLTGVSHSVSGDFGDLIAGGLYLTEDLINNKVVLGGLAQGTPDMAFGYEIKSTGGGGGGSGTFDPGEFLGANVYRNGELIAEGIMGETYTDEGVEPGYYDYCVVFVYEEGAMSCMTSCVEDVLILEDCVVPQGLTAEVNGSDTGTALLTWNTFAGVWLSYGDLVYADAIGLTDFSPVTVAIKFDPADLSAYDGKEFSKMKFYYGTGSIGTVNAQIWEGTTLVMDQVVTSTIVGESWNEVVFTNPVTIDGTKSYRIGYTVTGYDAYPAGAQNFTGDLNSDLVYLNGAWDNLSNYLPYSWLIEAFVSQPRDAGNVNEAVVSNVFGKSSASFASAPEVDLTRSDVGRAADRAFLGYNVYRDGVQVNEAPVPENMYLDTPGVAGEYCYTVTALYEYCGETEHSNEDCVVLTHVTDNSLSSIRVYPNPSNSTVTIELTNDVKQVLIYNYAGQIVHERAINKDKSIQVDVRNYEAGAYLIRFISNSGESFAKKLAVTK